MRIVKNTVVTIDCQMYGIDGECLDPGEKPIVYLHGDYDGILPGLEKDLEGLTVGSQLTLTLAPEDAFGEPDPRLIAYEPRSEFDTDVRVGMAFTGGPVPNYDEEVTIYRVIAVHDTMVVADGNHPLAGKIIQISCLVRDVRQASSEEIRAGRPIQ